MKIKINNRTISYSDSKNNLSITSKGIFLNGKNILTGSEVGSPLNIVIEGDIDKLETSSDLEINGNVGNITSNSGDIDISGGVSGNIELNSGDIDISGGVGGNVKTTSGDIDISGGVRGNVSSVNGDIGY